jgi:hypothetical protein
METIDEMGKDGVGPMTLRDGKEDIRGVASCNYHRWD